MIMKASHKLVIPAVGILVGSAMYVGIRKLCKRERYFNYLVTRLLENLQECPSLKSRDVRKTFQEEAVPSAGLVDGHSHAKSARDRNVANMFCRKLAKKLGTTSFSFQMSDTDQHFLTPGYRDWRWTKDIATKPCNNSEKGLSYMVDVDYYLEMGSFLAGRSEPMVIFTTQPSRVAKAYGDSVHYFNNDNELVTHVCGGAKYQHKLWRYSDDSLVAVRRFLGIPYCVTHYLMDTRHINAEKKLVLFTPVGTWRNLSSWFALWWIQGTELERLKPVKNGWATLYTLSPKGLMASVGRADTYGEATVGAGTLERMFAADRLSKQNANVGSVASWAESDREVGVIVADFIRENKGFKAPYVSNVREGVIDYSANLDKEDEEKPTITPFMPALVGGGCYAPSNDKATTSWGVESRVTNLKQIRSLEIPRIQKRRAKEFVRRVVGNTKLSPVDFETVRENQSRTTQRAILDEASNAGQVVDDTILSFMKREAYAKVGTPRVISTLPGLTKLEYSQYTLAAGKQIKVFSWYAFKKPREIAARVAEIVSGQELVAETDFSRMDGHVTKEVRELIEEPIMIGWFGEDEEMLTLMKEQYGKDGQLGGKRYETGYARASGSPETSIFNTILTAFISFSAMCELGLDYESAWKSLGVYGGDDGLVAIPRGFTADQANDSYLTAARAWGQVLKLDFKVRGEPVQFLARFYGTAWTGGEDSMSDVKRQIVKFHTTIAMDYGMTPEQKAADKAHAILLTDKNTPILGEFARKISTIGDKSNAKHEQAFRMVSYWAQFDSEDQFPNEAGSWMEELVSKQMPDFDREMFEEWLRNGHPMLPPQCLDLTPEFHNPEVTCIINDDIVQGTGIKPSKTLQASPEPEQEVEQIQAEIRSNQIRTSGKSCEKKTNFSKVINQSRKHSVKKNADESCSSKSSGSTTGGDSRKKAARPRKGPRRKTERSSGDRNVTRNSDNRVR